MKKLIFASLLLPLWFGCSSDEAIVENVEQAEEMPEVSFCSGVSQTRAVIEGTFLPEGLRVGIYGLIAEPGTSFNGNWGGYLIQDNLSNGAYTAMEALAGSQELRADVVAKFPADEKDLLVFAYSPYTEEVDLETATIPVAVAVGIDDTEDYLYTGNGTSTQSVALQKDPINLMFKHAMARMDIHIQKGEAETLPESATLKQIVVTTKGGSTGTMSLTDGSITIAEPEGGNVISTSDALDIVVDDATIGNPVETGCKFLLYPGDEITEIMLVMTRSDRESQGNIEYPIYVTDPGTVQLEAGRITKLTLTYLPQDVLVNSTLQAWQDGTETGLDAH